MARRAVRQATATRKRVTETLTISLEPAAAALLRQRAKRLYGGNVSAVVAELIADARISENIAETVEREGIDQPSAKAQATFDEQMAAARSRRKRRPAAA